MSENGQTDPEFLRLANLAHGGDKAALGELLQKYHLVMLAMANAGLSPELKIKDGASDIVQEAKLNAVSAFHQFRGANQAALRGWLLEIVRNVILERRQFHQRDKRDYRLEKQLNGIQDDSRNEYLHVNGPTPSDFVSSKEDIARVEAAIPDLPEELRRIVELRYRQYFSLPEIAEQLQITIDMVTYRWLKALDLLRKKVCPSHERPDPAQ